MHYKTTSKIKVTPFEPPCKKAVYQTLEDAEDMIRYIRENRLTKDISAYKCKVCGFWHLTSREK